MLYDYSYSYQFITEVLNMLVNSKKKKESKKNDLNAYISNVLSYVIRTLVIYEMGNILFN